MVVNPKNNVDNLSLAELAKIFRGERQYWRTDLPVLLLLRAPGSYEREVALRSIFRMTESQYKQYWISRIMRAEATSPPAELYSSGMTKEGVSSISGAIACINPSDRPAGSESCAHQRASARRTWISTALRATTGAEAHLLFFVTRP